MRSRRRRQSLRCQLRDARLELRLAAVDHGHVVDRVQKRLDDAQARIRDLVEQCDAETQRAEEAERALADAQGEFQCAETGLELQAQGWHAAATAAESVLASLREATRALIQAQYKYTDCSCVECHGRLEKARGRVDLLLRGEVS